MRLTKIKKIPCIPPCNRESIAESGSLQTATTPISRISTRNRGFSAPGYTLPKGGSPLDRLHQPIHPFFLQFDGFEQFELRSAAIKVVFVAAHFVIGITLQIIR